MCMYNVRTCTCRLSYLKPTCASTCTCRLIKLQCKAYMCIYAVSENSLAYLCIMYTHTTTFNFQFQNALMVLPSQRGLHISTVTGIFECLQSKTSIATEPKQVCKFHQFRRNEREDNIHDSISKVYCPS